MSTVLDALKRLQSERDSEAGGGGPLHEGVVDGGPPGPKKRRRIVWLLALAVLVLAGAAAGYLFLGTGEELLALLKDPASPAATQAEQSGAAEPGVRPAAESRRQRAAPTSRPGPTGDVGLEERMAKQNEEIIARMEKNLKRGTRARKARKRAARARADSAAQTAARQKKPAAPTPARQPAAEPPKVALQKDDAAPKPVARAPRPAEAPPVEKTPTPEQADDWKAGTGSVRIAARTPDPPASDPEPAPAVAPAAEPEPAPRAEVRPTPPKPAPRPEPAPSELPEAPLATALPFPEVSLEAVRWHPDTERREARLMVDDRRPVDVREGDIVAGVAVRRIDPGAVELTMGTSRMLVRIGD